jgi:hypothetical protein
VNHLMICRAIARARRLTLCLLVFLVPATQTPSPARADTAVDVLLVLAADISRSLDERKFRLQREGYAEAITSPRVVRAIESGPNGRIAVCLVEWSGPLAQAVVVDWTVVANAVDARRLAERIREAPRLFMDRTAIGNAIDFSTRLFDKAPATSTRRVIDVSGDGTSNAGRSVLAARDDALNQGITINGLAILSETPLPSNPWHTHPPGGLLAWYENNVIGGPGAFAMAAEGFEAFGASIASKLIKEIAAHGDPPRMP